MSMAVIEINREYDIDRKNVLKIDGKEINGIQNVKIEYGLDNYHPIVTIQVIAKKITGKIKTNKRLIEKTEKTEAPSAEVKEAWDKIKPKKVTRKLKFREYLGVLFR